MKLALKMNDLGIVNMHLGFQIDYLNDQYTRVKIHQTTYCRKMIARYGFADCAHVSTPTKPGLTIAKGTGTPLGIEGSSRYRKMTGAVMWPACLTRYDFIFVAVFLAQFMNAPTVEAMEAMVHLFKYIAHHLDIGITYDSTGVKTFHIVGFTDASYANATNYRTVGGYCFFASTGLVSYKVRREHSVVLSTAEGELVFFCDGTKEAVFIRSLLGEIGYLGAGATLVFCDNKATIAIVMNDGASQRTKHIDIRKFFVREKVARRYVDIQYCHTQAMLADLMTKVHDIERHQKLVAIIGNFNDHWVVIKASIKTKNKDVKFKV